MQSKVFVNRTLNLKRIKAIGFDMDHTLVRYDSREFEKLSHELILEKLVSKKGYPEKIKELEFDFDLAIRGLVLDRKRGNLLKLSRHGAIRRSQHGTKLIDYKAQQKIYRSTYVDLGDPDFLSVDTTFSISLATLFAQLVDMKDEQPEVGLPDYGTISDDVLACLDETHRDNSLKGRVRENVGKYIIKDPAVVEGLEKFKRHGKKLFLLTNSDFHYSKMLLDFAIQPFLKEHDHWLDLFEYVITFAKKPKFFIDRSHFLKVDPETGDMINWDSKLVPGIYQGGNANLFTDELKLEGDQILYIGDHIYGDILRLKKDCYWRTAMVLEELETELESNAKAEPLNQRIEDLMAQKDPFENQLTQLMTDRVENPSDQLETSINDVLKTINEIDKEISELIIKKQSMYNPSWGQLMRSGNEESHLAYQTDRYACIYMAKIADMLALSPRTYFRSYRRPLAHEVFVGLGDGIKGADDEQVIEP